MLVWPVGDAIVIGIKSVVSPQIRMVTRFFAPLGAKGRVFFID